MIENNDKPKKLWLLKGARVEPGWGPLEADARAEKIDVVIFDRDAGWALIFATEAPDDYEGMVSTPPRDGLYVSESGYPVYVVNCQEVRDGKTVIKAIGPEAEAMLADIGDAETVLQRLGYAY